MNPIKLTLISFLVLIYNVSCDTENKSDIHTETLESVKKQTPVLLDLSLPENTSDLDSEKQVTNDSITSSINKHLDKSQDNDYKFSGDIHLDPGNDKDKLLLEKIDGGQINLKFNIK